MGSRIQHCKLYRIRNCRHFDENTIRVFSDNLNFLYKVLIIFFCNPHFIFPGLQPHACLPFVIRLFLYVIYCDVCFRNINTSVSVNYSKIYIHFCKEHSLKYIYWLIFNRKYTFYGLETRFFKLVFIGSRLQINDRLSLIVRFRRVHACRHLDTLQRRFSFIYSKRNRIGCCNEIIYVYINRVVQNDKLPCLLRPVRF